MQERSTYSERSAKAVELYEKYLDIAYRTSEQMVHKESPSERATRHNRALLILNAIKAVTRDDGDWQQIVSWSLRRHLWLAKQREVLCLSLTPDFRARIEELIPDKDPVICRDMSYGSD